MLHAPIHHHLNMTGQNILTIASWVLTFVLLGVAVQMGRRQRTPVYVIMVLAAMVGAFAEALYDEAFDLYFYSTHGMQTFYTAFGIPQPVWTHSGYAVLYAAPAIYLVHKMREGRLTQKLLFIFAGFELVESCVFEITGINMGAYSYWGPHVLRIFSYPLVIGVLEAAQVMCFAVAAGLVCQKARRSWDLLALFPIFPVTFFGANFGAGAAVIIGLHAKHSNQLIVYLTTIVSIGCAVALVRFAASFLPAGAPGRVRTPVAVPERAPAPTPV